MVPTRARAIESLLQRQHTVNTFSRLNNLLTSNEMTLNFNPSPQLSTRSFTPLTNVNMPLKHGTNQGTCNRVTPSKTSISFANRRLNQVCVLHPQPETIVFLQFLSQQQLNIQGCLLVITSDFMLFSQVIYEMFVDFFNSLFKGSILSALTS
jgi:hypothetical protein